RRVSVAAGSVCRIAVMPSVSAAGPFTLVSSPKTPFGGAGPSEAGPRPENPPPRLRAPAPPGDTPPARKPGKQGPGETAQSPRIGQQPGPHPGGADRANRVIHRVGRDGPGEHPGQQPLGQDLDAVAAGDPRGQQLLELRCRTLPAFQRMDRVGVPVLVVGPD